MKSELKHTNANQFHCHHNNTGYCKFGDKCKFQHFYELCQKQVCREKSCSYRHPKSCKFGKNCKFFKRKVCVYKHIERNDDTSKDINKEIKDLEIDVKKLKGDIEMLKCCIESKQMELNKKSDENKESERKLLGEIKDQRELIEELKKENLELKTNSKDKDDQVKDLNDKINLQEAAILKFQAMLSCEQCDFQADSFSEFNFHLSLKHPVRATKHLKCTKCDFKAKKPLELEVHESIKHAKKI